jgi:hypothetical protein
MAYLRLERRVVAIYTLQSTAFRLAGVHAEAEAEHATA